MEGRTAAEQCFDGVPTLLSTGAAIEGNPDMKRLHRIATGLALLSICTAGIAQSNLTPGQPGFRDNRIQAGIVIPFGNSGTAAERAPRVETWSEAGRQRGMPELRLQNDQGQTYGPPVRVGLALASEPRLMLNGREVPNQTDRRGVSTLGWIGIGLGVAVIGFGAFLINHVNSTS
jgi:hypothetical protein